MNFRTEEALLKMAHGFGRAPDLRLIVVDCSGMTDGAREALVDAGVSVIDAGDNIGFGRAVNLGLEHVTTDVVVLINPDVDVKTHSLRALIAAGRAHGAVAWTGVLRNSDGSVQRNTARRPSLTRSASEYLLGADTRLAPTSAVRSVEVITGAAVVARTRAVRAVGGFDPAFPLYVEDVDLALRLAATGRLVQFPIEIGVHAGGESSKHAPRNTTSLLHASRVLFFRRQSTRRGAVARGIVMTGATLRLVLHRRAHSQFDLRQLWHATAPGFDLHSLLPQIERRAHV